MIFNSTINKVISSFEDLKKISKKHVIYQTKGSFLTFFYFTKTSLTQILIQAFENLETWGQECNNNAIHVRKFLNIIN